MVSLILKYLNKIKQFFLIIPILIGIMVFAGLFFANEKSKPEFASKTEKIMFDTKNKSPKYIITLPEENVKKPNLLQDEEQELLAKKQEAQGPQEPEKEKTNEEKLSHLDIPFIARVKPNNSGRSLPQIDTLASLLSEDNLPIKNGNIEAWEVYGDKVSVLPMFSKVAIVIKNMGVIGPNTALIIDRFPEEVSLSFSPYASSLKQDILDAREKGHETYLDLLLPSRNFALEDTGPEAMNFSKSPEENIAKLEKMLSKGLVVGGYVVGDGVDDEKYNYQILAIMEMMQKRGLLMLDASDGLNIGNNNVDGLDRVRADVVIDSDFNKKSIEERIQQAEKKALKNGSVIIVVDPKPVVVLAISEWLETFSKQPTYEELRAQGIPEFEKPLALVPLSNLVGVY